MSFPELTSPPGTVQSQRRISSKHTPDDPPRPPVIHAELYLEEHSTNSF